MGNWNTDLQALIDLDILQYRCGFAADSQMRKEAKQAEPDADATRLEEMLREVDYIHYALHNVDTVMEHLVEKFPRSPRCFIQGEGNFREQLATIKPYKGNRDDRHKPKYYAEIKQHLISRWNAEIVNGQESDDAIGIAQCAAPPDTTTIVSSDKDMDQIPGHHYNWVKGTSYYVTEEAADKMLFWQMLVGDTVDNIPGIYGMGPIRSNRVIDECQSLEHLQHRVKTAYKMQYGDQADMAYYEIGNLLYIRRKENEECPILG